MKTKNTKSIHRAGMALLSAAMFAFSLCSTTYGAEEVDVIETPEGAIIVDTLTATATVTAIDAAKRKITLVTPTGHKTTYKCGPEIVNFPQIKVGDEVKVTVTEEAAIFIGKGAPPSEIAGAGVALAPKGAKPGGVMVETAQITVKVTAVDAKKHKVTFELPDGKTKTVKVGKKVNLAAVPIGTDITMQVSEGLAISVGKP